MSSEFLVDDCSSLLSIYFDQYATVRCRGECQDLAILTEVIMISFASKFDTSFKVAEWLSLDVEDSSVGEKLMLNSHATCNKNIFIDWHQQSIHSLINVFYT